MALEKGRKEDNQEDQLVHVLVVDDCVINRILLKRLLTILSYHVTCVESAEKALEYLGLLDTSASPSPPTTARQDVKVNLIMTDYSMPGMTGYDLLLKVKNSSWKDVPVVVVSSEDEPSTIGKCLEGGAEEFLSKPVNLPILENLLPLLLKPKDSISKNDDDNDNNNSEGGDTKNDNNGNKGKITSTTDPSSEETQPKFKGSTLL